MFPLKNETVAVRLGVEAVEPPVVMLRALNPLVEPLLQSPLLVVVKPAEHFSRIHLGVLLARQ
jgi:hypothetical protein